MYALLMTLCVSLLGHDEWKVREWADKICHDPAFESYLRHAAVTSECPEVRNRASAILVPVDRSREWQCFRYDPEKFYEQWMTNDCSSRFIDEVTIIKDVQSTPGRRKVIEELAKRRGINHIKVWANPAYCYPSDHVLLDQFRHELKVVPEVMPSTIPPPREKP